MKIDVICAGLGRTGTASLKMALEQVGFGPCYHMVDMFANPDHVALWRGVMAGKPDWDALFDDYRAVADEPPALFWRELLDLNADAKVILTTRPAADWYQSVSRTVYEAVMNAEQIPDEATRTVLGLLRELIFDGFFEGAFENRRRAIELYEAHNKAVIDTVESGQLLVFDLPAGWRPLCRFLGVEAPDEPFPHVNTTAEFRAKAGLD